MIHLLRARLALLALVACAAPATMLACSAPTATSDAESQEQAAVSDIVSMTARGDGSFDVKCRDGRSEVVSADDVQAGRVCKPAVLPSSPFQLGACTGTPITEANARARLTAAGGSSTSIGTYVLALRRRDATYAWNDRTGHWDASYRWVDAPNDALAAWRETGYSSTTGQRAKFSGRGTIELAADETGAPYLRMVGEAANEDGPDTSKMLRLVSRPFKPWNEYFDGPDFEIESRHGDGAWSRITEYGWTVQTSEYVVTGNHRGWNFGGSEGAIAFMSDRCGQYVSGQSLSGLSPVNAAVGIAIALE